MACIPGCRKSWGSSRSGSPWNGRVGHRSGPGVEKDAVDGADLRQQDRTTNVEDVKDKDRFHVLLTDTAVDGDPYGWSVLQRLGLSVAVILRHPDTLERHLHIELLFQPWEALAEQAGDVKSDALLWMLQLSLRPIPRATHGYRICKLTAPAGKSWTLDIEPKSDTEARTLILIRKPARHAGEKSSERILSVELDGGNDPAQASVRLPPLAGPAKIADGQAGAGDEEITLVMRYVAGRTPQDIGLSKVTLDDGSANPSPPEFVAEALTLQPGNNDLADRSLIGHFDWLTITQDLISADTGWKRFQSQVTPGLQATDKDYQRYREWAPRFFEHGPELGAEEGPWLATAYPRPGSPALGAPDALGRLQWDHLIPDQWAHHYRYYVEPYDRYARLRQALLQTPAFRHLASGAQAASGPSELQPLDGGGIDLTLERRQPIEPPLVLSSRWVQVLNDDGGTTDGAGSRIPGRTWEVVVARHPEQTLSEHNRTLQRRLAFRQTLFSMDRVLLEQMNPWEEAYKQKLKKQLSTELAFVPPFNHDGQHLLGNLSDEHPSPVAGDTDKDGKSLDSVLTGLPSRLGRFSQQALVLHWDSLPFYYEHRLHLAAQTATGASTTNSIAQRDFGYVSPKPVLDVLESDLEAGTFKLRLTLARYWDCLDAHTRQRWPVEKPRALGGSPAKLPIAALANKDVVYQIIEDFSRTVEVQLELRLSHDPSDPGDSERCFAKPQDITKRYEVTDVQKLAHASATGAEGPAQTVDFTLSVANAAPSKAATIHPGDASSR